MRPLTIQLPAQEDQTAFNVRRWKGVLEDPGLAFFLDADADAEVTSRLCPDFPRRVLS